MIYKSSRVRINDEGTLQGYTRAINFTGSGVSASISGGVATVNVSGITGGNPSWYGNLYSAFAECDPQESLRFACKSGTIAVTPNALTTSVARIAYFRPPANITVNKIRYYGVGITSSVYRVAIYNGDTLARLMAETAFTTAAQTWGAAGSSLGLALTAGQLYFIAVSVNVTGATAGCLCMSTTIADTTGRISTLPKSWPGNLDIDAGYLTGAFAQFAVTTGALPDPAATITGQTAWVGGFPCFFLDNNNA